MAIKVTCDSCFLEFKVADQHAGKKVKCKSCGDVTTIPLPQRAVRKSGPRKDEPDDDAGDNWDDVDLDDAEDGSSAGELPEPKRRSGKSNKKQKGATSGNWYDRENLMRNPTARLVAIELVTALPGCVVGGMAMLYLAVWVVIPFFVMVFCMFAGLLAAIVLNPTAMISSLVVGKTVTNHLVKQGSIKVQQESPVIDLIMKYLLKSLLVFGVGLPMSMLQMLLSGAFRN